MEKAAGDTCCHRELVLGQLDEVVWECVGIGQNDENVPVDILGQKFLCGNLRGENDPSNDT